MKVLSCSLVAGATLLSLLVNPRAATAAAERKTRVLIDADTANEVNDLYAVVRAVLEPDTRSAASGRSSISTASTTCARSTSFSTRRASRPTSCRSE